MSAALPSGEVVSNTDGKKAKTFLISEVTGIGLGIFGQAGPCFCGIKIERKDSYNGRNKRQFKLLRDHKSAKGVSEEGNLYKTGSKENRGQDSGQKPCRYHTFPLKFVVYGE